jgi:two-component system LytT family sensor kinase
LVFWYKVGTFEGMSISENQRIIIQIAIWLLIGLIIPLVLTGGVVLERMKLRGIVMFFVVTFTLVYNVKYLFPRFYAKEKFRQYIIASILTTFLLSFISNTIEFSFQEVKELQELRLSMLGINPNRIYIFHYLGGGVPILIALFSSAMYEIALLAKQSAEEAAHFKAAKLEAELKFLKSQINPHFLFNSLNNIYTLTVLNPEMAGDNLLKLSEMLRYLLYECDAERVYLAKELAYLNNYIDLFTLKDEEPLNIKFDGTNTNCSVEIAPLLLIPFVENAFKHSYIEDLDNGWIEMILSSNEKEINFTIKNSIPTNHLSKDKVGGIGLNNVKRQLELTYPNQHQLKINASDTVFEVQLIIDLSAQV